MPLTLPNNVRGPILDLSLPATAEAIDIVLRSNTTGKSLTINLPAAWGGDDLSLDWFRRTVTDQTGADRSALLDPQDLSLWTELMPLVVGSNDIEIEAAQVATQLATSLTGTASNDSSSGSVAWSNPSKATASDNVRATAVLAPGASSHYLRFVNAGLTIPVGSKVVGVSANAEGASAVGAVRPQAAHLIIAGVIQPTNRANTAGWGVAELGRDVGGGSTDLWGVPSLSRSDIEHSEFGFALSMEGVPGSGGTASIDALQMGIFYKIPKAFPCTAELRWEKGYY